MEKDTVITLDDNSEYLLLENKIIDNKEYFLAVKLGENEEPTKEYEFFEVEKEDNDNYINTLDDENKKNELIEEFAKKIETELKEDE